MHTNDYKCTGKTLPFLTQGFNKILQTHVIFDSPGKYVDDANANATPMDVGRFITPSHLTSPFHHIFGVGHGNLSGSSSTENDPNWWNKSIKEVIAMTVNREISWNKQNLKVSWKCSGNQTLTASFCSASCSRLGTTSSSTSPPKKKKTAQL